MTSEQFLEMIMTHTLMMNCRFWKQHSDMLLGCIVAVHNQYADSVLWERDPKEHRRHLASVLRMSGDDLFILVAMICGGIGHMRKLSPVIRETDWLRQQNDPTDEF